MVEMQKCLFFLDEDGQATEKSVSVLLDGVESELDFFDPDANGYYVSALWKLRWFCPSKLGPLSNPILLSQICSN